MVTGHQFSHFQHLFVGTQNDVARESTDEARIERLLARFYQGRKRWFRTEYVESTEET